MRVGVRTDIGLVRERNEDAYHVGDRVWVVADGLGGHQAGEVASQLAVKTMAQASLEALAEDTNKVLISTILEANRRIYEEAKGSSRLSGMGTTITAAFYDGRGQVYIGHVGDSRAYMVRDGVISQLTEDHSVVALLLKEGTLSVEEARVHPQRNYLTRALGVDRDVEVDLVQTSIFKGDYLVLTTDGLTNMVSNEEILRAVTENETPQESCDILIDMARRRGGTDNITVLVVGF
jgi:serine/threonine protein phosphatase PrpC